MKAVPKHQFLFLRSGSYYFRRAVPPELRSAFGGKSEVIKSLGTRDVREARHLMQPYLRDFDQKIAAARNISDPTRKLIGQHVEPSGEEVEAAVRRWFSRRVTEHQPAVEGRKDAAHALGAIAATEAVVRQGFAMGANEPSLQTSWIAEAVVEQEGWLLPSASPAYNRLVRTVARAQLEVAHRERQEIKFEPHRHRDELFAPARFAADASVPEQRPQSAGLWDLFNGYAGEAQPKPATIKAWKRHMARFIDFLGHSDASRVTTQDVINWKSALLQVDDADGHARSTRTVRDTYLAGIRTVFRWAAENGKIAFDPTASVRVRVSKKPQLREKALRDDEAALILKASMGAQSKGLSVEHARARRWVPWLCAYSGARVNEMTQLRAEDVMKQEGIWVIRITPEAGTVKNSKARIVPLHSHLIEQGFVTMAAKLKGPLFYAPGRHRGGSEGNPQYKKVGERLASWVRDIGVTDRDVAPNHGWRHRLKTQARLVGMDAEVRDAIQGHRPRTEGEEYGHFPVAVLKREIEKLPRYVLEKSSKR